MSPIFKMPLYKINMEIKLLPIKINFYDNKLEFIFFLLCWKLSHIGYCLNYQQGV